MNLFKLTALIIVAWVSWVTLQNLPTIFDMQSIFTYSIIFFALMLFHSTSHNNLLMALLGAVKNQLRPSVLTPSVQLQLKKIRQISYTSVLAYLAFLLAISDAIYQQCQTMEATVIVILKAVGIAALLSLFISEMLLVSPAPQPEPKNQQV